MWVVLHVPSTLFTPYSTTLTSSRVHDAHALGVKVELLGPGPAPGNLGDFLSLEVPDNG